MMQPLLPSVASIRPRHFVSTQAGVEALVSQTTLRRFGKS
jgi:hypothetical protein